MASKLHQPPPIKQVDSTQRSSYTGELLAGKQVLSPLRFFVSDPQQHCNMYMYKVLTSFKFQVRKVTTCSWHIRTRQ